MQCEICGEELPDEASECTKCGTKLKAVKTVVKPKRTGSPALNVVQYAYMLIIMLIPIAGLVVTIMWACKKKSNVNRINLARAVLIVEVLLLIIFVVLSLTLGGLFTEFLKNYVSLLP